MTSESPGITFREQMKSLWPMLLALATAFALALALWFANVTNTGPRFDPSWNSSYEVAVEELSDVTMHLQRFNQTIRERHEAWEEAHEVELGGSWNERQWTSRSLYADPSSPTVRILRISNVTARFPGNPDEEIIAWIGWALVLRSDYPTESWETSALTYCDCEPRIEELCTILDGLIQEVEIDEIHSFDRWEAWTAALGTTSEVADQIYTDQENHVRRMNQF